MLRSSIRLTAATKVRYCSKRTARSIGTVASKSSTSEDSWINNALIVGISVAAILAGVGSGVEAQCESEKSASSSSTVDVDSIYSVDGTNEFAFVVAGAGSAGCLTAYLLAHWMEEQSIPGKVLLLDRGPDFNGKDGPDPVMESWYGNWGIFGEAHSVKREDGSDYPVTPTTHNGVGGCGTHDTRISFVMRPEQRQRVAEKMGWTYEQCSMYFQAALDMIPLLPAMPVEEEYYTAIVEAFTNPENPHHLHRLIDDFAHNGNTSAFGDRDVYKQAAPVMDTIGQPLLAMYNNELRWTSAYLLRPGVHRPHNLVVVPHAIVDKLIFDQENQRAVAVKFLVNDKTYHAVVDSTKGEIALTSGALGNVGILQRSGIGPRALLEKLSIPVVGDNALVGHGTDHPEIALMYEWVKDEAALPRGGVNGWPMVLFATALPADSNNPKQQKPVEFMAHFGAGYTEPYTAFPSVVASPNCMQPDVSAGYLATITSANPHDSLLLTHLHQEADWKVMVQGLQRLESVFLQAKKQHLVGNRLLPPPEISLNDTAALIDYVKDNHFTVFHWACTTRAGIAKTATPVDEFFRIRKHISNKEVDHNSNNNNNVISNVRVGSASSLPEISEANPHMSIHAFSFALAHTMMKQNFQSFHSSLPKDLQRAKETFLKAQKLVVRKDGEETPKLGRVATEYFAQWKQEHPTED